MIVGVPKETKRDEYRVALLPVGAEELARAGHTVLVEAARGSARGWPTRLTPPAAANWSTRPPRSSHAPIW